MGHGQIGQRVDFLASTDTQNCSADQKERDIGADFGGDSKAVWARKVSIELALESDEGGNGIGRTGAESALYRKPLVYMDVDFCWRLSAKSTSTNLKAVLRSSVGTRTSIAGHGDAAFAGLSLRLDGDQIVCREGLVEGGQRVEAVRTRWADGQAEIDLRKRANARRHANWIVARCRRLSSVAGGLDFPASALRPCQRSYCACFEARIRRHAMLRQTIDISAVIAELPFTMRVRVAHATPMCLATEPIERSPDISRTNVPGWPDYCVCEIFLEKSSFSLVVVLIVNQHRICTFESEGLSANLPFTLRPSDLQDCLQRVPIPTRYVHYVPDSFPHFRTGRNNWTQYWACFG